MKNTMIRQLTAMILACGLTLAGCAGSGGQAPAQGQTAAGPENTAGPENAAADPAGTPAAEEAQDTESSAPGSIAPAGREGLRDFEEDADASSTGEGSRELAPVNQTQKTENARITMTGEGLPAEPADYTLMIFMVGSNLETEREAATNDLEEMLDSGIDFQKNNVIVYTGGARKWTANVPCDRNCLLDLSRGSDRWVVGMTDGSSDMGAPETLTEFLRAAAGNYPADHYGLVFWDHGSGPIRGFGADELFGLDSLQFDELRDAMDASPFGPGGGLRLDWAGFDACLMGSLENACLWQAYTDYLVASEELEPAGGWDYSFLQVLNTTADPVEITGAIAGSYYDWYTEKTHTEVTMACLDLSMTGAVIDAYAALARKMRADISGDSYAGLVRIRRQALTFGAAKTPGRGSGTDLVDLDDLAEGFSQLYGPEAEAVRRAVSDMVLTNRTNVEGAAGLSVYFPCENQELYDRTDSLYADSVSVSDEVKGFYDSYTDRWQQASAADWTLADFREEGDEILLDLTPEQAANLAGAVYSVLYPVGNGQYNLAMGWVDAAADEEGGVHIPADPVLIGLRDEDGSLGLLSFMQINDHRDRQTFASYGMYLSPFYNDVPERDWIVDQGAVIVAGLSDGQVVVRSVEADDSEAIGKNTLDLRRYNSLGCDDGLSWFPTRNEDGSIRSFADWEGEGNLSVGRSWNLPEDKSIRLEACHVSDFSTEEPMILQAVLYNVNGQEHPSGIYSLQASARSQTEKTIIIEDAQGTWTYTLREESAVLTKYQGNTETLTIPGRVNGLPVTEIAENAIAFPPSDGAAKIILPDTIRTLQRNAIRNGQMTSVSLPAGLEYAASHPFDDCDLLEQILIDGDPDGQARGVRAIDGVLFSADGTVLLEHPMRHGAAYAIPEGTETIAYRAFDRSSEAPDQMILQTLSFPETVRNIEPMAFYECSSLSEIPLPESLNYVGANAFGTGLQLQDQPFYMYQNVPVDTIYIGPNVEYIGKNAFDGLNLQRFEVSDRNRNYSVVGGMLAVKSGDTILEAPRGTDGLVYIPEGVVGIENDLFRRFCYRTEFYLPDSLTRIPRYAFPEDFSEEENEEGRLDRVYHILFHCSDGSAAAQYADQYGIRHDDLQADASLIGAMQYTSAALPTPEGELLFHVYENHAVLAACRGRDTVVEIPAAVEGRPVTEIGDGRDSIAAARDSARGAGSPDPDHEGKDAIKSLLLPDTVTSINANALNSRCMELEVLDLPASLEHFDSRALGTDMRSASIGAFRTEGGSVYRTIDGMLYTADGKTLICCPWANNTENPLSAAGTAESGETVYALEIPAGTETIGPYAFLGIYYDSRLLQITWPEELREIGPYAFRAARIYDVRLPEGVKTIGDGAFYLADIMDMDLILPDTITEIGSDAFSTGARISGEDGTILFGFRSIHLPAGLKKIGAHAFAVIEQDPDLVLECENISLGSKVSYIGERAFMGQNCRAFEVSPRNKTYSAADGFLLSADGKTLLTAPFGMTGEVTIPEGVTEIRKYAMRDCPRLTDVHISAEVTVIGIDVWTKKGDAWTLTIHCPAGSAAAAYAEALGIPWAEEN